MTNLYGSGKMMKHVGRIGDKRIVVVMQLPESPTTVEVIDTEALPPQYHQTVMDILESPEGQAEVWLGTLLHRRIMPDGSGNALQSLYKRNLIKTVEVSQVSMLPKPNQPIPLTEVIRFMTGELQVTQEAVADQQRQAALNEADAAGDGFVNQHAQNFQGDAGEERRAIAQNLMFEAKSLQAEADRKRAMAAEYDPSLAAAVVAIDEVALVAPADAPAFIDEATGKAYKTEAALRGAVTRRTNKAANE